MWSSACLLLAFVSPWWRWWLHWWVYASRPSDQHRWFGNVLLVHCTYVGTCLYDTMSIWYNVHLTHFCHLLWEPGNKSYELFSKYGQLQLYERWKWPTYWFWDFGILNLSRYVSLLRSTMLLILWMFCNWNCAFSQCIN